MNHSVVIAFDGDEAGLQAADNSLLTMLDVEDDERDYLRAYVVDGKTFRESIAYLSNQSLSDEYRFWSVAPTGAPNWMTDLFKENAETVMAMINYRANQTRYFKTRDDMFGQFNTEHTITDVLASYGHQGIPGRSVRCPVHDDSSPSLSISKDDGRAYCFNQSCELWHDGYGVDAYELNRILGA